MTRSTEVQVVIMNKGVERGLTALVTELFERMTAVEAATRESALIQLRMIEQLGQVVDGAGAIRKEVEHMQGRHAEVDDDLPQAN